MADLSFSGESAQNYAQKCLCVLVLDTSGSMNEIIDFTGATQTGCKRVIDGTEYNLWDGGITRLNKLTEGLESFYEDISNDISTSQKLELAIISFNDEVEMVQSPMLIDECMPPKLSATGNTNISDAMELAMDLVEARKSWYRTTGQKYYRPWIILITDGEPNKGQNMDELGAIIRDEVNQKHFEFLPIGVDNANMAALKKLQANLPAIPMKGAKFSQFFKWLSASMSTITEKKAGEKANLSEGMADFISNMESYEI